ncbi:glycoside hydrolase family 9 protein [Porcipelethomonas sp.]|uniref:glycoside hydrolase family 9 protein n=1 Tax=Porcipelethomonas sp. TaxID=2981675 RepID=UPI003EF349ED
MKKLLSTLIASVMLAASVLTVSSPDNYQSVSAESVPDYAEALQKSLYFYECQQAGPLPDWNRVEWRDDSTMDDYITGGWYDAGDHVKFNLPMAYSATMIAWGLYQYPDGIEKCGEMTNYVNNLTFVLDYLAACDLGDEVVYQVGNGQQDHTWWGPAELVEYGMKDNGNDVPRPYYKGRQCSAAFGDMAAALAAGYCALQGRSDKTDYYLEHAKNIFEIADTERSDDEYQASDAQGFYSSTHFYDELFWAANWLYIATGEQKYLDKATSYIPNLGKELGTNELKYSWGHCWDDVQHGGMVLYAQNTKDQTYINQVKKQLDYWTYDVKQLDGGLRWLTNWGCLRHATAEGFIAAVACDTLPLGDTSAYKQFYEEQINYCLGDNPNSQSFVIGYGENAPLNAHHRTAHSSWNNALANPVNNRHILYGALVGGPTENGEYEDDRQNFINNEVACDYNAGFTGLLAKMVSEYGGTTDPDFPEPEQHETEFYVEAKLKQSATGSDLSLKFTNHTAWPARIVDNMSYRYYLDATEVINAGFKAEDIVVRVDRDQALMYGEEYAAEISPLTHYKDNIYYVEVTYPKGEAAMPISEGNHQCETMLALVFPNYQSGWDASNDYSNTDLLNLEDGESAITDKITIYENGVLIYGVEPDGTTPSETTGSSEEKVLKGDTNLDKSLNISDLVLLNKHLTRQASLKNQALANADYNEDNYVNIIDSIALRRYLNK